MVSSEDYQPPWKTRKRDFKRTKPALQSHLTCKATGEVYCNDTLETKDEICVKEEIDSPGYPSSEIEIEDQHDSDTEIVKFEYEVRTFPLPVTCTKSYYGT